MPSDIMPIKENLNVGTSSRKLIDGAIWDNLAQQKYAYSHKEIPISLFFSLPSLIQISGPITVQAWCHPFPQNTYSGGRGRVGEKVVHHGTPHGSTHDQEMREAWPPCTKSKTHLKNFTQWRDIKQVHSEHTFKHKGRLQFVLLLVSEAWPYSHRNLLWGLSSLSGILLPALLCMVFVPRICGSEDAFAESV